MNVTVTALSRLNNNEVVWAVVCHVSRYITVHHGFSRCGRAKLVWPSLSRVQPPRVIRQNVCGSRMPAAERNDSRADDLKTCQPRRGALRNAAPINRTSWSTRNPLSQFPFIRINLRNNRYLSFSSDMRDPWRTVNAYYWINLLDNDRYSPSTLGLFALLILFPLTPLNL